jgi:CrcB protein
MGYAAFILVFVGGTAGSLAREMLAPLLPGYWVWLPILLINVAASFVIGWLYVARDRLHPGILHLGAVGFCGGFSTFSHFTRDTSDLILAGRAAEALAMVAAAVGLGLAAAVAGETLGRRAAR